MEIRSGALRPLISIGSNPVSNTHNSAREVAEDNREDETQNDDRWCFHDCLSADHTAYSITMLGLTGELDWRESGFPPD